MTDLRESVRRVVEADNCSGCGACALLSDSIRMQLDAGGFSRPSWQPSAVAAATGSAAAFRRICPGVRVTAPPRAGRHSHPTMGDYVSVWSAWSTDAAIRFAGSSGGVLSALSAWMLDTGVATSVIGVAQAPSQPTRTAALQIRTRDEVIDSAGSRYAPVPTAAAFDRTTPPGAFIGKPCEVYAVDRLLALDRPAPRPVLLSFFCAGVPSQHATDELVEELGADPATVSSLRYRGNGWPGEFVVEDVVGGRSSMSYDESWGAHLGSRLQYRCKICPDGTGGHADIAVGDFWAADEHGFPQFTDRPGVSVAVARTARGHELLLAAQRAGVLALEALDLDAVAAVQPFQVQRRETLLGRLLGRLAARRRVPRYRGYAMIRLGLARPRQTVRFMRGSYRRSR